jgi:hypothetical protein
MWCTHPQTDAVSLPPQSAPHTFFLNSWPVLVLVWRTDDSHFSARRLLSTGEINTIVEVHQLSILMMLRGPRSSAVWLPWNLSNHMDRQALTGGTVLVGEERWQVGANIAWGLGRWGVKTTENNMHLPRWFLLWKWDQSMWLEHRIKNMDSILTGGMWLEAWNGKSM